MNFALSQKTMDNPLHWLTRALGVSIPTTIGYVIGEVSLGAVGGIVAAVAGALAGILIAFIQSSSAARAERTNLIKAVNDEREVLARRSERVHAQQIQFFQDSLRYRGTLEIIARENAHNAMGEVWRCQLQIRIYEDLLREAKIGFEPFAIKDYDALRSTRELPSPPEVQHQEDDVKDRSGEFGRRFDY